MISVGIALGSNLGDRAAEIAAGLAFLQGLSTSGKITASRTIETEPVDCAPGTPFFLNAVAEIELDPAQLPPRALLEKLQAFETSRGRAREREVNAPRPLDLDIIYYGQEIVREPGLLIPHPRALRRRFVLEPLAQIRPELILPGQSQTIRQLIEGQ